MIDAGPFLDFSPLPGTEYRKREGSRGPKQLLKKKFLEVGHWRILTRMRPAGVAAAWVITSDYTGTIPPT